MFTCTISGKLLNSTESSFTTEVTNRTTTKVYEPYTSDGSFYSITLEEPNINDILEVTVSNVSKTYVNKLYYVYDGTTTILQDISLLTSIPNINVNAVNSGNNVYIFDTGNYTNPNVYNVYLRKSSVLSTATDQWMHVDTIISSAQLSITFLVKGTFRIDTNIVVNNITTNIKETIVSISNDISSSIAKKQYIEWE